ncbi:MAG: ABC transporter permease [Deltaproteobacteria bacterium]|nr:ABC transporter permease [Deltaproteobacteria bacterium]
MRKLFEIYRYRELLKNLVVNELKLRYRRSALGFLWSMLNPLLTMIVLTLVFSTIMRFNTKDYWVLLLAGMLPWIFFSQAISGGLMSIVGKGALLKKVYIPKTIIPLSTVLAGLVNFMLSMLAMFALMAALGRLPNTAMLFLPVSIGILTLFTCGMAFLFSCLNVYFRDFTHMTEVLISAWFYASPVIYTVEMVPERFRPAFAWNPMLYVIECFRAPIFDARLPSLQTVSIAFAGSLLSALIGFVVFVRFERGFILRV